MSRPLLCASLRGTPSVRQGLYIRQGKSIVKLVFRLKRYYNHSYLLGTSQYFPSMSQKKMYSVPCIMERRARSFLKKWSQFMSLPLLETEETQDACQCMWFHYAMKCVHIWTVEWLLFHHSIASLLAQLTKISWFGYHKIWNHFATTVSKQFNANWNPGNSFSRTRQSQSFKQLFMRKACNVVKFGKARSACISSPDVESFLFVHGIVQVWGSLTTSIISCNTSSIMRRGPRG